MVRASNIKYTEISNAEITDTRSIVVSRCSKGGFTIAQKVNIKEGDMTTPIFMKGAFHVDTLEGLYNVRDAINVAILKAEQEEEIASEEAWDNVE